ncbi:unnamed protein product [Euphydryas editha]|uniref:Uncharacterized protein n=1 Tax=Euphydryas editha TaxID=104508 RepID=A0AAU9VAY5_EUPED|nr:unnamed protein product [Euphydryas editha]
MAVNEGLVAVVWRKGLAAGGEVACARRGALRARQRGRRGGRGGRGCSGRLARHVARFPHGRPYNTPNTELFYTSLSSERRRDASSIFSIFFYLYRSQEFRSSAKRVECLMNVVAVAASAVRTAVRNEIATSLESRPVAISFRLHGHIVTRARDASELINGRKALKLCHLKRLIHDSEVNIVIEHSKSFGGVMNL